MRRAPINPLANCLIAAIPSWRNLVALTIDPMQAPDGLFVGSLRLLRDSPDLRILRVNAACADGISAPVLSGIVRLRSLTLIDPNRAILDLLPDWLSRLSGTLRKLHLLVRTPPYRRIYFESRSCRKDNCGSITPGVLQTIQPLVPQLESFALGLSYSLEDGHVLEFLSHLPRLQDLQLRYYWVS